MNQYPYCLSKKDFWIHIAVNSFGVCIGCMFAYLINPRMLGVNIFIGDQLIQFSHLVPIILAGCFSGTTSMVYIIVAFFIGMFVNADYAYMLFIMMITGALTASFQLRGWLKKPIKTLFVAGVLSLITGPLWYLLVCLVSSANFSHVSARGLLALIVSTLPECLIGCFFVHRFVYRTPDEIRRYFYNGYFETEEFKADPVNEVMRLRSVLNIKVMLIFMGFFALIIFIAVFISAMLLNRVNDRLAGYEAMVFVTDVFPDGYAVVPGDAISTNKNMGFLAMKIGLMLFTVGGPLITFMNFSVRNSVIDPIRRLSFYLKNLTQTDDEDRYRYARGIHKIMPKTDDEIKELYNSTDLMLQDMSNYIEDVKEGKRLSDALAAAEAANQAKDAFVSNISHEIRTPINAVIGMDEMIIRETKENNIKEYAYDIKEASKTLLGLINDILDFSKLSAGRIDIVPEEYELSAFIGDIYNMISVRAKEKGLELIVKVDPKIPHILYGDDIRLKQCIVNMLTNAVKYTEKGSVKISFEFNKIDSENIALEVHAVDTGQGIKREDMGKLFKPFERLNEKKNRTIEGTGLGLNIVKELLELMGTELQVKSVFGKGSDFYFVVNQEVVRWSPVGELADTYRHASDDEAPYRPDFYAPDAKILVVDDTPMNITVFKGLLKQSAVQIDSAGSGEECLKLTLKNKYDVIFLDHRMPGMDGIETLQKMRENLDDLNLETPVIALTANAISGARETYFNAGFDGYIPKPIDFKMLERILEKFLPEELVTDGRPIEEENASATIANEEIYKVQHSDEDSLLRHIQGIDYTQAISNCMTEEVLVEALKDFANSIKSIPDKIEKYYREENCKEYTVLVHGLKSSARMIGAKELSEKAAYLEKCGDVENLAEIRKKTDELLALYRKYDEWLKDVTSDNVDDDAETISTSELKEAYQAIRDFAETFNFDEIDAIIKMMGRYRIPDEEKDRFEKVKELVANVDRDGLLEIL